MAIPRNLIDAALAGSPQAQVEVGRHHAEGRGVPYDLEEAFRWFSLAELREHPDALLEVALAKEYGLGTDRDYDSAFHAYMKAVRRCSVALPFTIRGMTLCRNLCMDGHLGVLTLAEAGYAHAQWSLVYGPRRTHQFSEGKDAPRWIRKAAALGYPPAVDAMTSLISSGRGTPEEESQLLEWLLKDFENDKSAAGGISRLYEERHRLSPTVCLPADKAKSEEWMRIWQRHMVDRRIRLVAGGSDSDAKALAEAYFDGKEGLDRDYGQAMKWLLKASELGCMWSPGQIAKMHLHGLGVPMDVDQGLAWLDRQYDVAYCQGTKVRDQGLIYHWAMRTVVEGYLDDFTEDELFEWLQRRTSAYVEGCGALNGSYYGDSESARLASHVCKAFVPHVHAAGALDRATRELVETRVMRIKRLMARQKVRMIELAEAGDAAAEFWHSKSFTRYKNRGGYSLKWLLKSAGQGFSPAQYVTAKCYIDGDGAPVSEQDARKWLSEAAYQGHSDAQRELICVLNGTQFWGDRDERVARKPSKADVIEAYAWLLASERRMFGYSRFEGLSATEILEAYRRADVIREAIVRSP
ncbi:MAG: hypothetical protein ACR2KA_10185 [Opitutales bacterium]